MGKRKQHEPKRGSGPSATRVEIIPEELSSHPRCPHGPTLLFSSERGQFYACASCRGRECRVHISREDWDDVRVKEKNKRFEKRAERLDKGKAWKNLEMVKLQPPSERAYCVDCDQLHVVSGAGGRHAAHRVVSGLDDGQIQRASTWLPPLANDSVEAQYLFSEETVQTILRIVRDNNIRNILCIGTPSVHEAAQQSGTVNSLLLDYDSRHHRFWPPDRYLWYNMFNHHFFNGPEDEHILDEFLKSLRESGVCVVMDPPFGGRVEPLAQTLATISRRYVALTSRVPGSLVPVIWTFPYFSEPYITNLIPEMRMHDYQVEYTNHCKFKKSKPDKLGSPVRVFTNLPLDTIDLSHRDEYRLCAECCKWVSKANRHCVKCGECASKNGATYVHCDACARCVKPTFFHCDPCGRCCQRSSHVCGVTVPTQSCYNCQEKGHKKIDCPQLKNHHGEKKQGNKKRKI